MVIVKKTGATDRTRVRKYLFIMVNSVTQNMV